MNWQVKAVKLEIKVVAGKRLSRCVYNTARQSNPPDDERCSASTSSFGLTRRADLEIDHSIHFFLLQEMQNHSPLKSFFCQIKRSYA